MLEFKGKEYNRFSVCKIFFSLTPPSPRLPARNDRVGNSSHHCEFRSFSSKLGRKRPVI